MTPTSSSVRRTRSVHKQRRVIVLVVPPVEELDLVGPIQVLGAANRLAGRPIYRVEVATTGDDLKVEGEGGLISFLAHGHYKALKADFDSLLLVCGLSTRATRDRELFAWMRSVAPSARRMGSVCVGSFLFAEAGLLDGRRATTHWKFGQEFAKRYPKVSVATEPIWVRDGNIYTSAGISAGIDLALAWVEEDCGNTIASEVARELVLFLRRPGSQAQLSVSLAAQSREMRSIQELQVWIVDNLHQELSLQILAQRVAMSVRNFERVFTRELGVSPARYVVRLRIEAAQRMLERSTKGLDQIALACGFSGADAMRRAFMRTLRTTPRAWLRRLSPSMPSR